MTVYAKRAIALPNPNATDPNGKDSEIVLKHEAFAYNVPDGLKEHPYFQAHVADGNLIVMEAPQDVEKVTEGKAPKRANADKEADPNAVGIVDGGEVKA